MERYGVTFVDPATLVITIIAALLILFGPRRAVIPMLVGVALFIPMRQRVVILGLDFMMHRILVVFGWARLLMTGEHHSIRLNRIDRWIILWVIARIVMYVILWRTFGALINRLGSALDTLGLFFLFRALIRDFDDIEYTARVLLVLCIALMGAMSVEFLTGRNLFSVFGGVNPITQIREGRLRCQGAFAHPILAGTFGASLIPLFAAGWWRGDLTSRVRAAVGTFASLVITVTSASSGPVMTVVSGATAMAFWPLRKRMRTIRRLILLALVVIQLAMNGPIWALMWRAAIVPGSTGYHRYRLFDQFVRRIGQWWFCGVRSTGEWGYFLFDVTNQYVGIAVDGGLLPLVIFIFIAVLCFSALGRALKTVADDPRRGMVLWALGSMLYAHLVSFMGVAYFDQIFVLWYLVLAMISSITGYCRREAAKAEADPEPAVQTEPAHA